MDGRLQTKLVYFLGFMILGIVFGFWVVKVEARITKNGFEIAKLQNEHERLIAERKKLEAELAIVGSPDRVIGYLAMSGMDIRPVENVDVLAERRRENFRDENGRETGAVAGVYMGRRPGR